LEAAIELARDWGKGLGCMWL